MALNKDRLKGKIKAAWLSEMENENETDYLEKISDKLATAIIEEILKLRVEVPEGIRVATTGTAIAQTGVTTEPKIANLS
ncbi:hypothetical protein D1Z98_08625 [Riemerella anatipestifer]|uniref:hypothetical protein n=1 Tax=Riemerella anatipestifer TaxID=34085 RepID=UPI00129D8298|nr:hypothetical protein [Riemerella anatipestifer]MRM95029.1 hypothetical protein [Riemerella anatipestifer]